MRKSPLSKKRSRKGNRRWRGAGRSSLQYFLRPLGQGLLKGVLFLSVVVIISFLFLSLYQCLLRSRHLKLEQVEVEGVSGKIRNELIEICDLNSDLNMLALKLEEMKKKMERHPWIREVKLERRFPNTLIIRAQKERALALVVMDALYYVNRSGEIFKKVHKGDEVDFPIITGVSMGRGSRAPLMRAIRVLKALAREKGPWSIGELSEIHIKEGKGMSLYFNHLGAEIKLVSEDVKGRITLLKKAARHLSQKGRIHLVKGIDLNCADEAVVSFRKG